MRDFKITSKFLGVKNSHVFVFDFRIMKTFNDKIILSTSPMMWQSN